MKTSSIVTLTATLLLLSLVVAPGTFAQNQPLHIDNGGVMVPIKQHACEALGTPYEAVLIRTDNGGKQTPRHQHDCNALGTPTETILIYTEIPYTPPPWTIIKSSS